MEIRPSIRILQVEDSESDALLLKNHLRAAGLAFELTLVEDLAALRAALIQPAWDILLTDFNLPGITGLEVVAEAARLAPGLPCIIISGEIGEDAAVEALRAGAKDFVSKFRLARLLPAIQREVSEARHLKQAERAVRRNEEQFQTIFEQAPLGIALVDTGTGRIQEVNSKFAVIAGWSRAELITLDWMSITHPDDLQEDLDNLSRLNAGEIPGYRLNKRYIRSDGSIVWLNMTIAPIQVEDQARPRHLCMIEDITKQKETEDSLRRSESLFSTINRHLVDLVAIIDREGRRLYNSPSYQLVLGYSEEEMKELATRSLLHPEDYARVHVALHDMMDGHPTQGLHYRLQHKDGRWLHFESTAAIIPDEGSGQARALTVARNITERKEAEQNRAAMEVQLRQAQKLEAIGQLAAGIAHEINTPTQYIGDNTTFLHDSFDDTFSLIGRLVAHLEEIRTLGGPAGEAAGQALDDLASTDLEYLGTEIPKAIQQTLDGVGRISKIVKAMKDFSHPGGEAKMLTDLHRAIESTITVSRNEWKYAAELVTDFDPQLPEVPCFPGEFNQVILNLIVNAAHAIESAKGRDSGNHGLITVATRRKHGEVLISVSDDGTGISPEVQARMFDPFFTTKPVGKGSGQGLSIVHAVIVEKHKGRIEVASAVGKGTVFSIFLPLEAGSQ